MIAAATSWLIAEPGRRGVLLVGPPGVGVSSATRAVANALTAIDRPVAVFDDCHSISSEVFDAAIDGLGEAFVVLGAHAGLMRPLTVGRWWAQGLVQRFEVSRLTVSSIIELSEHLTGYPLSRPTAGFIHGFTGGLALYVREVLYELSTGAVELVERAWVRRSTRPFAGPRLIDLAMQRTAALSDAARRGAQVLAVSGPVPVDIALGVVSAAALDELQSMELVEPVGRGSVKLTPPALEAGTLGGLTLMRQAEIRRGLLAAIAGKTCPPDLLIRVGQWALDDRQATSGEVLVRAAEAAVGSGANEAGVALGLAALQAASASPNAEVEARARLVVGRCQWYMGSMRTAIEMLVPLLTDETLGAVDIGGDEARARAGQILAELLRFGQGSTEASERVLHVLDDRGNGRTRQLVQVLRPVYAAYSGDIAGALAEFDAQAGDGGVVIDHRAWSAGAYTICLAEAGRTEEAVRIGLRALHLADVDPRERPFALASIVSCLVYAQLVAGGPAQVHLEAAPKSVSPVLGAYRYDEGLTQLGGGLLLLSSGDVRGALDELLGAHAGMRLLDPSGFLRLGLALGVEAAVLLGRAELAEQFAAQAEDLPQRMSALMSAEQHRSMLWLHHLHGGSQAVREAGEALVGQYVDQGLFGAALRIQHSMLRLSVPCPLSLAELFKTTVSGAHPQALIDQLLGVARGDLRLLLSAAQRLEDQGCLLLAAECLAMAEQISPAADGRRTLARRIVDLTRTTGEVMSPALCGRTSSTPLTARESEVATQVASGLTNAQVAMRLNIKVRTVETHLQRVYEKLGVNRRTDVAAALTDT